MILYNVTINIEESLSKEWVQWMKNEHIPEVMATGKFTEYKMFKVITRQPDETGVTYSIQYFAKTMADYESYTNDFGPALKMKTMQKYGDKLAAFRTVLETV